MMGLAWLVTKRHLPINLVFERTLHGNLPAYVSFPGDVLLGIWLRWDAVSYMNLARSGYFAVPVGHSVFYPLYPFLVRAVTRATQTPYTLGGLIVSTAAAAAAFASLYRVADRAYGAAAARWSVIVLAVYPTAFFLITPHTESLFLALTLGAFLCAYEGRWWLCGSLGALASLTRGPGLLTPLALSWLAWQQWRASGPSRRESLAARLLLGLVLPLSGSLAFLVWRTSAGFPPMSETLRQYSGLEMTNPVTGLISAFSQFIAVHDLPICLDVLSALLFLGLTLAMTLNARWRHGEWLIYMIGNLALFLSKRSLVASSLQSLARYVLVLFPAFIILGDWLSRREHKLQFRYVAVSSMLLLVLSVLYALYQFVG